MAAQQNIPLMQSRGGGGGGSPDLARVAITNFITDQNKAQQKMMSNFSQLQASQAQAAREDSQQQTASMNKVAAQADEKKIRQEALTEKYKDRTHAEEYAEWTNRFNEQAKQDSRVTQARLGEQMAAGQDFLTRMDNDRASFGDEIKAHRAYLLDPGNQEYWLNTPGGLDRLETMQRKLRAADAFHESNFQSKYTSQVSRLMAEVNEQIESGESHADLTTLYDVTPSSLSRELDAPDHDDGDWTDAEIRELQHSGGYPPGGLFGRDPDDPALKKYRSFNPIDFRSGMQLLQDEQAFASIGHAKYQDDYIVAMMQGIADRGEVHGKIRKNDESDYNFIGDTAEQAVYAGTVAVVQDLHSGKLSPDTLHAGLILNAGSFAEPDMRSALAGTILESTFMSVAGPGGDGLLKKLNQVLDGTGDEGLWDTEVELGLTFAVRNRLLHVRQQLKSMMTMPTDQAGKAVAGAVSLSTAMGQSILQRPDSPEQRNLLRSLAMLPGDEQRGSLLEPIKRPFGSALDVASEHRIHKGVDRMFGLVIQKVNHLLDIVESQPAMKGYNAEVGDLARRQDAYVASYFSDKPGEGPGSTEDSGEQAELRMEALGNITDDQRRSAFGEAPKDFDVERDKMKMAVKLSPLQAYLQLVGDYTDKPELLAALISGDYDNAAPEFPTLRGATKPQMMQALKNYTGGSKKRRDDVAAELKRRREARGKRSEQSMDEPPDS